jgi:TolB-like protein/predicted Zn-dependent protease
MAYAVVGWVLVEVASIVLPTFGAPDWVMKVFTFLIIAGFPLALIFAWAFEMTPEGIKREHEVDRSQSITHATGRKLDYFIIAVMAVGLIYFAYDKFVLPELAETTEIVADDGAIPLDTGPSIAVLPFANMSADESSAYFSDGLADTVLHMLAQIRELRVAARTSSFQFRGQSLDIAEIGEKLNVTSILEGSVQKSGDKIRVTAQLIDVSNGYHLWSGTFDRNLDDIFAIQDEIASEVVAALKVSLLGETVERLNVGQTDNVDAYTEYLLAIDDLNNTGSENLLSAVNHLQEAIRLDPNYARAYSTLGRAYISLLDWGVMSTSEGAAAARSAASRALDIDADSSEALAVLGMTELRDNNRQSAGQLLEKAVEKGPNDTVALDYFASYLNQDARPDEAIATYRKMLRVDPLSESAHIGLAFTLINTRKYSEASEAIAKFKSIQPLSQMANAAEFHNENAQGKFAAAVTIANRWPVLFPDDPDPEGPAFLAHAYLALDMPGEASKWFGRAVEVDAEHPMSRSAPLWLNYYLRQNEAENVRLARELLEDGIDPRNGSRAIAFIVLIDYAAKTGSHDVALELLDNTFPYLFDDPPRDLDKNFGATFTAGWALIQSGDVERGSHLVRSFLELQKPYDEVYGVVSASIGGQLLLENTDLALNTLDDFTQRPGRGWIYRLVLERSPMFDPIREEPAFVALMDEYRRNAEEQRQLLQAMNEGASTQ